MSININFNKVVKKYGDVTIIPALDLQVKQGEFFTLLGPSGCGKTTLLRMVAGFNSIEGGEISFNEKVINQVPPAKRNIGMVFQNYAIFPHMTVKDNVAFGLKNRKVPAEERDKRIDDILKKVRIHELRDRMPENMSGGQQQRVALARAIVIEPSVLLMDEPLSNLDAKLRVEMRNAIKDIQKSIGITTVYVTHDQEEAMAVSDRIAVMNGGVIQHAGTPHNIYMRPANIFVATFIGSSNILDATLEKYNDGYYLKIGKSYELELKNLDVNRTEKEFAGKTEMPVKVSIRPEEYVITDKTEGMKARIRDSVFLGLNTHYFINLEDETEIDVIQESSEEEPLRSGCTVYLELKKKKINVFSQDGSTNLTSGVVNDVEKY